MDILVDVNILVALADAAHLHQDRVRKWFNRLPPKAKLLVCRTAQMGLLRLLVSSSVMKEQVFSLREAWAFYGNLLQNPSISEVKEPDRIQEVWAYLCFDFGTSPKVVTDAYLAAFAISGGFKLVSLDKGFRKFEGLDLIEP